jgi:hypothetical protein
MLDTLRTRDCVVFYKEDSTTVTVQPTMVVGGWPGGQGIRWSNVPIDDRTVDYSDGRACGFLIWGSDEPGDDFASTTRQQLVYRYATMLFGGCLISTSTYERYTYASRIGGGPLVPLIYTVNQLLYFSSRGFWTSEDELTLSGSLFAPAALVGRVAQLPKSVNSAFLGIQVSI